MIMVSRSYYPICYYDQNNYSSKVAFSYEVLLQAIAIMMVLYMMIL